MVSKFEEFQSTLTSNNIEPKMLDIVTALEYLGIKVSNSCQGHLDKVLDKNINYEEDLLLAERSYQKSTIFYPYIEINNDDFTDEAALNLMDLIDEFYANRITPMRKIITISNTLMKKTLIKPQSGDADSLKTDPEERQQLYNGYHEEFTALAEFLKSKINK